MPRGGGAARRLFLSSVLSGVDNQLVFAQRDELIVPPQIVKSGAVDHLRGKIPGFASGGVVGNYSDGAAGLASFTRREDRLANTTLIKLTAAATAAALKSLIAQQSGGFPGGGISANGRSNIAIARSLLPLFGFGQDQMQFLIPLWMR
jgi:hypothetical protein